MPPKIYQTKEQKKKADSKRRAEKRAKDKRESIARLTKEQIISQILNKLVNDVVFKVIRKIKNRENMRTKRAQIDKKDEIPKSRTRRQAVKRSAVRETSNVVSKHRKNET